MKRSSERIIVTHVGSLVRPSAVRELMAAREKGQNSGARGEGILRDAVAEVVRQQVDIGIDIPSDGEFGKPGWVAYVNERLGGLKTRDLAPGEPGAINPALALREGKRFAEFHAAYEAIRRYDWTPPPAGAVAQLAPPVPQKPTVLECVGPITYTGQALVKRDIDNFRAGLSGLDVEEAFLPVAAPLSAQGVKVNRFYPSEDTYIAAIADALREEYRAIYNAGFLIQLDDAFLTSEYDRLLATMDAKEVHKLAEARVELLNYALSGIPEDRVRYHVCWGSWNVPHTSDVPLTQIVDLILKVRAQAYSIEAANARHEHEFQVWKDVKLPDGKILIPGVISHATNIVEHPELVAWRLTNFANLVGRENVIAGTDCGFAQNWFLVRVHPSVQWAKLEALVEGARLASRQLWHA
jgi:5-methyltetrahydropteroyltriglutamate--homocysteine methyltransferase